METNPDQLLSALKTIVAQFWLQILFISQHP
jgi:hypothetical protein